MNSDLPIPDNDAVIRGETGRETLVASACLLFFMLQLGLLFVATEKPALKQYVLTTREGGAGVALQERSLSPEGSYSDPAKISALAPFLFLPIAVNSCDKQLLMSIRGIGPGLAEKILQRRAQLGSFQKPEDLLTVNGIGPARLRAISPFLSFASSNEK